MRRNLLPALAIAFASMLVTIASGTLAAQPLLLMFPDTPCDSLSCSSITLELARTEPSIRTLYRFRDGVAYRLDSAALGADTIAAGNPIVVPICFRPSRRGQITDSLLVVVRTGALLDTFRVRVTGRGIGPELEPAPFAVNFPRTNPGSSSRMKVTLSNVGELPYTFDASAITIPPPFQLATPGPIVIPAGGSIDIDIDFAPVASGVYAEEADLRAGCVRRLQVGLNGATELIGTGAVLRISKLRFNPVNDEETPCAISRCTDVTVANAGNAPLVIDSVYWGIDTAGYRITNVPSLPLIVPPNSSTTFEVCLEGRSRGRLADTLVVRSNSRTSIAFGMVLDFSQSMLETMNCGTGFTPTRYRQAIEQAQRFIGRTLLHLPAVGVQDHLAVMRYSYDTEIEMLFPLQPVTEALKVTAQDILTPQRPSICRTLCTFTGAALARMMDTLTTDPLQKRVIVLLSDGRANDDTIAFPDHTDAALAVRARSLGIRIFTIGIGTSGDPAASAYLTRLAVNTGGQAYDGNDCGSLQQAFESITDLISRGQIVREPFAIRVTAPMVISSGDLAFDSTYYMTTTCRPITLTNVGEGDVVIDSIQLRDALGATTPEFTFGTGTGFPLRIPESGQVGIDVCFTPSGLRQRGGRTSFTFNSCQPIVVASRLSGVGWARAGMRIDDERIGLPGSLATMPVYLDTSLAEYEVSSITFEVRWNKSMLDLRTVRPREAAGTGSVSLSAPVRFEGGDAIAQLVATGSFRDPVGALAELEFMVLRGDSLASEVMLTALNFEDGNPKPLMRNAGLVAFDSTCFRDGKAISTRGSGGALLRLDAAPVPARRGDPIALTLSAADPSVVRITVYTTGGALAAATIEHVLDAGDTRITIPTAALPAGAYFLRVEDGSGATHLRSVLVTE